MLEFIKKSYLSTIEGVVNTETEWKITSDRAGLNILDSVPMSSENLNSFKSDIIVAENTSVYIWYKLKLSNGEIKDWVGPIEYISRENNISNDLKPITRVKTPTIYWDDTNLHNGNLPLVVNSSEFKGDSLDGHLATTWIFKTPEDKIITYSMFDTTNRLSYSLNRNSLNLNQYEYINCYIKHHSANGATSDFNHIKIPTRVYPFRYSGSLVCDSRDSYTFSLTHFSELNPMVDKVEFIDVNTGKLTYTVDTTIVWSNITIPSNTFKPDNRYKIICHLTENPVYPKTLELELNTKKISDMVEYSNVLEYDINSLTTIDKTINIDNNYKGVDRLISNQSIVYNLNNLYRLSLENDEITTTPITKESDVLNAMSGEYKLFNISKTSMFIIYRLTSGVNLIVRKINIVNNHMMFDVNFTPMSFVVDNTNHNLKQNSTISEDGKYIYSLYKSGSVVGLISFNLTTGVISILDSISSLVSSISITNTILVTNADRKLIIVDTNTGLWYNLNIGYHGWIELGVFPDAFRYYSGEHRYITLADRSILFLNTYNKKLVRLKTNLTIEESNTIVDVGNINTSNIVMLDSRGVLIFINRADNKLITLNPNKII